MRLKSVFIFILILAFCLPALTVFAAGEEEMEKAAPEEREVVPAEQRRYVHVVLISTHPFWTEIKKGAQDAADQRGVKYEFTGPVEFDAAAQADQIRQLVTTRPTGMIVGAYDPSMTEAINYAVDAGIPVICCNGDAPDSKRLCFVGEDFYREGLKYGAKMSELLGGKGTVGILTVLTQVSSLGERVRGIQDYFASNAPNIKVVAIEDNGGDDQITADKTKTIIQANPDIGGIIVVNATGSGVATAVKEMGKVGEIKVITSDVSDPIMEGIAEGVIDVTFVANIYYEGYYALAILDDYVSGAFDGHPWKEAGVPLSPTFVDAGGYWGDKKVADFYLKLKK